MYINRTAQSCSTGRAQARPKTGASIGVWRGVAGGNHFDPPKHQQITKRESIYSLERSRANIEYRPSTWRGLTHDSWIQQAT